MSAGKTDTKCLKLMEKQLKNCSRKSYTVILVSKYINHLWGIF